MALVEWQVAFGPRYPGADGHAAFHEALTARLAETGLALFPQKFEIDFSGRVCPCANHVVRLHRNPDAYGRGPLLVGTHFDTRIQADRESDPEPRDRPIPGANDGGSGTAVLLHLIDTLKSRRLSRDVAFAFFDAEDVGNIDGYEFSVGAEWMAANPVPFLPDEVLILDMIGGRDMVLDIDAHSINHGPSRRLTEEIFALGASLGMRPFTASKPHRARFITSDHAPFLARDIASCLLIDLDYPEWHTQGDLPAAMSGESLRLIEDLLLSFIFLA